MNQDQPLRDDGSNRQHDRQRTGADRRYQRSGVAERRGGRIHDVTVAYDAGVGHRCGGCYRRRRSPGFGRCAFVGTFRGAVAGVGFAELVGGLDTAGGWCIGGPVNGSVSSGRGTRRAACSFTVISRVACRGGRWAHWAARKTAAMVAGHFSWSAALTQLLSPPWWILSASRNASTYTEWSAGFGAGMSQEKLRNKMY